MKITKTQLTKLIRESVKEQIDENGRKKRPWNIIMKLLNQADESGLVQDIGHKQLQIGKVHEFAINNEMFVIVRLEDLMADEDR